MKYTHRVLGLRELGQLGRQARLQDGVNLVEWFLNTQAPGKVVAMSTMFQPVPGPLVGQPTAELVFHFVFEVVEVIS